MKKLSILGIFLVAATLTFGVNLYYRNQQYRYQIEAGYQRAFRELTTHTDGLEQELAKLTIVNSYQQKIKGLANILRLVYALQANIGQLPINGLNLSKLELLLARIQTSAVESMAEQKVLSDSELQNQFVDFYHQVQYVNQELQNNLGNESAQISWIKWGSYAQTSISRGLALDPDERFPLIHALVAIEDGMDRFYDSEFPSELGRFERKAFSGDLISQIDAEKIASDFLANINGERQVMFTNESDGVMGTYTITADSSSQEPITIEIAKNGGYVLWMTNSRLVNQQLLPREKLIELGEAFLNQCHFTSVELVGTDYFQHRLVCSFVALDNDILVYPRQIKVQVAADNGEIVGFHALEYHSFSVEDSLKSTLTSNQAKESVNKNGTIVANRSAIVLNNSLEQVLTYEFRVNHNSDQFLVYINAESGAEEKIAKVGI